MNPTLLLSLAVLTADPSGAVQHTIYRPQAGFVQTVSADDLPPVIVRAQDSPFYGGGGSPPTYAPPGGANPPYPTSPGTTDPFGGGGGQPYGSPTYGNPPYGSPQTGDPFVGGSLAPAPNGYDPFGAQGQQQYTFGLNGAQPFQYGWHAYYDFAYLASSGTSGPNVGDMAISEADFVKELVTPIWSGYTFTFAPQVGIRGWEGPLGTPGGNSGLPGDVYRFGLGLKLATPNYGPWQFELGFNPALGTDFSSAPESDGIMFDGHAAAFLRTSPQFTFALGAAYWDRVDQMLLPYAGVVWTPSDRLELRLLFPKSRISWFAGTPFGVPTWLYVSGEYHVESYQVNVDPINRDTRVQIADWRLLGGIRSEFGSVTTFVEAGGVFNRDVKFDDSFATDFDIDDGFILRGGFRY